MQSFVYKKLKDLFLIILTSGSLLLDVLTSLLILPQGVLLVVFLSVGIALSLLLLRWKFRVLLLKFAFPLVIMGYPGLYCWCMDPLLVLKEKIL